MAGIKITVLGCGASAGVPAIGNNWGTCDPKEPKNNRTRASIALQSGETTLVVDTGPDLRQQLNREDIQRVTAILYTHAHGDHVAGIDELRSFQRRYKTSIPIYGNKATIEELEDRFAYMFENKFEGFYPKVLDSNIFSETDFGMPRDIGDITFIPFEQDHNTCISLGYRFGGIGYSTDMINLNETSIEALKGIKTWIVDGAGYFFDTITVHANVQRVLELNEKIGAERVFLTHLSLVMDYQEMCEKLPENFYPCYDGLTFETE